MTLELIVHRATDQIGGNCIELATDEGRILLDVGRPLDAPNDAVGLLPQTLDRYRPLDGVLISHPHQDHYGLLEETPAHWPIYSGAATERLMQLTASILVNQCSASFPRGRQGAPTRLDRSRSHRC